MVPGVLLLALLLSACIHYRPAEDLPPPFPFTSPGPFTYPKEAFPAELTLLKQEKTYRAFRLTYPSPLRTDPENDRVEALFFLPRKTGRPPVVLFLPILHKGEPLTDSFARYFASRGIAALSFRGKKKFLQGKRGLLFAKEVWRQSIIDVRRGMDWLEGQRGLDTSRMGICGISLGAVQSVLVAGVDRRLGCAAYLLGGGNIPKMLLTSEEKDIVRFRREVMALEGLDLKGFRARVLSGYQEVEPLNYAGRLPPGRILMIDACFDHVIVRECSDALWELSGRPHRVLLPTGHFTAILYLPYARWLAYRHFRRCFAEM